jgi:hypothetical protein
MTVEELNDRYRDKYYIICIQDRKKVRRRLIKEWKKKTKKEC